METKKSNLSKLVPMMFAFFAMGFVDMVGTATNYVKADFELSDTMA
ncbi:MAG: MFS transporter, partial [Bacteroidales bacterium]|nr:MFS transporter [Bacteroidales bacterium]